MSTEPPTSSPESPIPSPENTTVSPPTESPHESPPPPPTPWVDSAIAQTRVYQKTIDETLNVALEASRSRLSQFRATGSAHLCQTLVGMQESLEDVKSNYVDYEKFVLWKISEGVSVAKSQPLITSGVAAALGLVVLRGPRRFLYRKSMRLFLSEESLLSRAENDVKELWRAFDHLKAESQKLEIRAANAENEFLQGRKKLRYAGQQIQTAIGTGYKIDRQARGLKDLIRELPRREASVLSDRVKSLVDEAKRERKALSKEVMKISNYGISV